MSEQQSDQSHSKRHHDLRGSPLNRVLWLLPGLAQDGSVAQAFRFRASVAFSITSALPSALLGTWELIWGTSSIGIVLLLLALGLLALPWVAAALGRRGDAGNLIIGAIFLAMLVMTLGSGGRAVNVNIAAPILVSLAVILSGRIALVGWVLLSAGLVLLSMALRQLPGEFPLVPSAVSLRTGLDRIPLVLAIAHGFTGVVFQSLMFRSFDQAAEAARNEAAARAEAEQAQARFADFAAMAGDWLWETDDQLRLTYISQGFEATVGVSPAAAIGLRPDQIARNLDFPVPDMSDLVDLMRRQEPDIRRQTQLISRSGEALSLVNHARPVYGESGRFLGYRGAVRNVTELEQLAERLAHQAAHDPLTGLVNRGEFEQRLQAALNAQRSGEGRWHLVYIDLDHFKVVNDRGGHAAGDRLLKQVAEAIASSCRAIDTAARVGGDEFALLLSNLPDAQVEELLERLARRVRQLGRDHAVGAKLDLSYGVIELDRTLANVDAALAAADAQCYRHKARARGV